MLIGGVILFALLSFASVAAVNYYLNIQGHELPLLIYGAPFPVYGFFFVLGVWLARHPRRYRLTPLCAGLLLSVALAMAESWWQYSFHGKGVGIKMSVYLYSTFAILILFSRRLQDAYTGCSLVARLVQRVGEVSFGVYLTHCYFIVALNKLCPIGNWTLHWLAVTAATMVLILVGRRVAPRFAVQTLGFH